MHERLARYFADHVRLPVEVRMNVNRRTLVSFRRVTGPPKRLRLSIHRMFGKAPDEVLASIATWMNGEETNESRAIMRRWMNSQTDHVATEPGPNKSFSKLASSAPAKSSSAYAQPEGQSGVQLLLFDEPDEHFESYAGSPDVPLDEGDHDLIDLPPRSHRRQMPPPPERLHTQGRYYNLREMADRMNYQYFGGECPVYITWGMAPANRLHPDARDYHTTGGGDRSGGSRTRSILFGTYSAREHLVRVHPRLDAPDVPDWFIEYIVYHEMLHKWSPPRLLPSGRRDIHTREFRRLERHFPYYRDAQIFEKRLLRMLD